MALGIFEQARQFVHRLPRNDDARHAVGAFRARQFDLRQTMPVGRDRAQRLLLPRLGGVEVDAVEIIARFFRRDGKARLLDQALQVGGVDGELVADFADSKIGKVFGRQGLQRKARVARGERQALLVGFALQFDLGAFRQFAHDVVQHVRGNRQRAGLRDFGVDALGHFAFEVGRLELQAVPEAFSMTFDRMGMVVRRSTTLVTWLSAFNNSPRSISRRMGLPGVFCVKRSGVVRARTPRGRRALEFGFEPAPTRPAGIARGRVIRAEAGPQFKRRALRNQVKLSP